MQAERRKPLSPVKANGQHDQRVGKDMNRKQRHPTVVAEAEDVFAQSTTKPKKQSDKIPAFYVSKIPRATPSPDAAAASGRHVNQSQQQRSKIPKPSATPVVEVPGKSRPGSAEILAGFQSYSNPSFVDNGSHRPHAGLATPEAVQILQQAGNDTENERGDAKNKGMGAIMNAYLRTGPQKLSPEPSKDYCITAPKPAAVPPGAAAPKYVSANGVPMTVDEYLCTGLEDNAVKVPAPKPKQPTVQIPTAVVEEVEEVQQPVSPEPAPTPEVKLPTTNEQDSLQGNTPASVCSNIPDVFDDLVAGGGDGSGTPAHKVAKEDAAPGRRIVASGIKIRLLPAVDSQQTTMADSQATTADVPGTNYNNHHRHRTTVAVPASPTFMPTPEEEAVAAVVPDKHEVQSRRPSPVAFALPSSDEKEEQQQQSGGSGGAASSGGSFSFGFGAGARAAGGGVNKANDTVEQDPGSPTPEACIAPPAAEKPLAHKRPGSGDSVDQPNLFVSMLDHFKTDGPGAYASPHRPRDGPGAFALPVAPWLQAGYASPRPGGGVAVGGFNDSSPVPANGNGAAGPSEGSPQSPLNCTPMHLLSEGAAAPSSAAAAVAATPELGKGDLVAWIDRRGMRDMLSSPAAADLRRMWNAMRESANSRAAAASAAAENEVLRVELEEARAALERLGAEHSEALTAAQAGQQWAEAEVIRAREAAQHMMALADQIQSTFALCEQEKAALAQELEEAWTKAAQAEEEAQAAALKAAASDEERAKAADLNKELQLAQEAAHRAAIEAAEAQALARTSAAELAAIKEQLAEAHEAMVSPQRTAVDSDSDNGEGVPSTPFSTLRAQLHSAHEALTALHASGSKHHRATAGPTSPHLDRLYESSAHGLTRAQELLQQDTCDLHQANDELRALLSGVQARIMQLSPTASDNEEEEEVVEDTAWESQQQETRAPSTVEAGTVTVDFRELRSVLAQTTGQPVPLSPLYNTIDNADGGYSNSCDVEIDGVMVTNIPSNALSQVRNMVEYFEELAGVKGVPLTPTPQTLIQSSEENKESIVEEKVWTPVPATAERLRAFLPPRAGVTPAAGARPTPANGGVPPAPAPSPLDELTPGLQRLHLQGLDALAALQYHDNPMVEPVDDEEEEEEFFNDEGSCPAFSAGVPPTPEAEASEEFVNSPCPSLPLTPEDSECCSESSSPAAPGASSPALETQVTPVDMVAIQQSGAAGLRDEVRARLQRLKAELQAARSKLSHVDRGLAAIATPNRAGSGQLALPAPATRLALQGPVSLPSPFIQQAQQQPQQQPVEIQQQQQPRGVLLATSASAPAATMHITPALAGATPRTRLTNRPSVRFADSVKFNSEDDQPRRRLPRTPGISGSTSSVHPPSAAAAYRAAASPQPMVASTIRIADPIILTPSSAFAIMANGGAGGSSARRPHSASGSVAAPGAAAVENEPNPSRKLDLGSYDDSSSDDDDNNDYSAAPNTQGSARSRMAMQYNGHIHSAGAFTSNNGGMTPASRTPMAHPGLSKYYGPGGDILPHNATPLSRFSSASSYVVGAATGMASTSMSSPDSAALLSIRPAIGRVWRGNNNHSGATGAGARRVSDSEEREFRRRAAALKIHVSPYFKRTGPATRSQRDQMNADATVL